MKPCVKCGISKQDNEFRTHRKSCRACERARERKWKIDNPVKNKKITDKWVDDNRDKKRQQQRDNYQRHKERYKEKNREYSYKTQYGITIKQYDQMHTEQDHRCAICRAPQDQYKSRFAVDHDHDTGKIRGLLCIICNRRICGMIDRRAKSKHVQKTNVEFVEALLKYYKKAAL